MGPRFPSRVPTAWPVAAAAARCQPARVYCDGDGARRRPAALAARRPAPAGDARAARGPGAAAPDRDPPPGPPGPSPRLHHPPNPSTPPPPRTNPNKAAHAGTETTTLINHFLLL